jgi:hypothetical protein
VVCTRESSVIRGPVSHVADINYNVKICQGLAIYVQVADKDLYSLHIVASTLENKVSSLPSDRIDYLESEHNLFIKVDGTRSLTHLELIVS